MFKNIFISLTILIIASFLTSYYKKQSKDFVSQIEEKKKSIFKLKQSINLEMKESIFLKSPENIKKLANKYLEKDYIFFDKKNIEYININEKE